MTAPAPPRRGELTSLDERLGLLLVVRCALVGIVVTAALVAPAQVGISLPHVGPISALYLAAAGAVEWFRRSGRRGRLHLHRAMLPLDSLYLALITAPSGGPRSDLEFLFAVQLIAVTILASPRTGIRIALWDSFLFIVISTFSLEAQLGHLLGVRVIQLPNGTDLALSIMAFWAVALCTAFFSSVSERELRRSKGELAALAALAADLEEAKETDAILITLLRFSMEAFGFRRGALYWGNGARAALYTGELTADQGSKVGLHEVVLDRSGNASFDMTAMQAQANRTPALVRSLNPETDPILCRLLPDARNVVVLPLSTDAEQAGVLALEHGGHWHEKIHRRTLAVLEQFGAHATLALRSARLLAEVERMAAIDGLTGLANRREFEGALSREVGRAIRTHEPLSLLVVDVDHFKHINDSRGHLAGDEVLRSLARVLDDQVREMDLVSRFGGEEFAILLPSCSTEDAERVGQRIRTAVSTASGLLGVTVSIGVATLPAHAGNGIALVAAADQALYAAKRGGRDQVARCSLPGPPRPVT